MDIGISGLSTDHGDIGLLAQKIEELGFESIWLPEHPVIPVVHNTKYAGTPDGSIPDSMSHQVNPFIALARASGTTKSLKFGTAICLVTEHNPIDLAKQISTLDFCSDGRFIFGIGTGWFREESEIMGADFDHRWTQAREHVLAMKELWTQDAAEFHGRYVDFPAVRCYPKPAQTPHPPVLLGGSARRVLNRVVAWGDGWLPIRTSPEDIKTARATLSELAEAAGRDPNSISITVSGLTADRDLIDRFEEAGADRVLVRATGVDQVGALSDLEEIARKILR
ncbi:MAG: LLM class F420-dependent oxidoreductase [Chloroflexi bacterium]|nr:LLM class F420-dependent oxidoreductase [Chloroflexota bacterium]